MRLTVCFIALLFMSPLVLAQATIRVGLSPDYPPLQYKDGDRIVGVEADNALAVAKILGKRLALFEYSFDDLIPALEQGRIDVIMSGFSVTAERSQRVAFANPYMQVGQMAILHKSKLGRFSQPWAVYREGVRIGVEPGTTGAAFAKRELTEAEVSFFANPTEAFQGLRDDKIDLYIHDAPTSWRLASSSKDDDLISTYKPLTNESLAWAVRKDDTALLNDINGALQQMQAQGTLTYIINRWIPVQVSVE